ncbi:hypothetical protein ACIA78_36145 [Streptomyces xanthochromogenes]|uniref:hypothetical protein n=1 Tax=Streptomyces xanthochromogenes TaxID=67384 RepID=UPI0037AAA1ED
MEAVFYESDLPDSLRDYRTADREVFVELGSPGSSRNHPVLAADHAVVDAKPLSSNA